METQNKTAGKTATECVGVTETQTSPHAYIRAWNEHIKNLSGLAWNLEQEDYMKLKGIQAELEVLMEKACKNLIKSREAQ